MSRALNRSSWLKIYRSSVRPVVTYGCEAWTLTNRDEELLRIFERRILREIFVNSLWAVGNKVQRNYFIVHSLQTIYNYNKKTD